MLYGWYEPINFSPRRCVEKKTCWWWLHRFLHVPNSWESINLSYNFWPHQGIDHLLVPPCPLYYLVASTGFSLLIPFQFWQRVRPLPMVDRSVRRQLKTLKNDAWPAFRQRLVPTLVSWSTSIWDTCIETDWNSGHLKRNVSFAQQSQVAVPKLGRKDGKIDGHVAFSRPTSWVFLGKTYCPTKTWYLQQHHDKADRV